MRYEVNRFVDASRLPEELRSGAPPAVTGTGDPVSVTTMTPQKIWPLLASILPSEGEGPRRSADDAGWEAAQLVTREEILVLAFCADAMGFLGTKVGSDGVLDDRAWDRYVVNVLPLHDGLRIIPLDAMRRWKTTKWQVRRAEARRALFTESCENPTLLSIQRCEVRFEPVNTTGRRSR